MLDAIIGFCVTAFVSKPSLVLFITIKSKIKKVYYAITWGKWRFKSGKIEGNMIRKKSEPTCFELTSTGEGKYSKSTFRVLRQYSNFACVEFKPYTGRTHQIRVHSSSFSNPIFGDNKYGGGLKKDFDKVSKNRNELTPMVFQSNYKVMVEGKPVSYYQLSKNRPLQLDIDGSKKLRILSRLVFDEYMGSNETYRLRVKNGKKVLGTYFLSSERSSTSYIVDIKDKVPGKWRTCEIDIPAGKQIITVEIVENNKNVLTRFQEYK